MIDLVLDLKPKDITLPTPPQSPTAITTFDEFAIEIESRPTDEQYPELSRAFRFLNSRLFDNRLPEPMWTLSRRSKAAAYASKDRFQQRKKNPFSDNPTTADEIALNPNYMHFCTDLELLAIVGHEMTHIWQFHFGTPSRNGYHNGEWAAKMISIGLMPSSTGEVGGDITGQDMSHYIITNAAFHKTALDLMQTGWSLNWQSPDISDLIPKPQQEQPQEHKERRSSKTKFTCPTCGQNAWAKPSAHVHCGECHEHMTSKE
jgi:predicted SprT family Zn-dependent metalloprotease